jgi:hypothetical protein
MYRAEGDVKGLGVDKATMDAMKYKMPPPGANEKLTRPNCFIFRGF